MGLLIRAPITVLRILLEILDLKYYNQGSFWLKSRPGRTCGGNGATHTGKLITPEGEKEFKCPDDVFILDQAEEEGVDLPCSCRAGACSSCAAKIVQGTVDQFYISFLGGDQIEAGWVLTCYAYPMSDLVIETLKEEELISSS